MDEYKKQKEELIKKALESLTGNKPSVTFSSAKINDCVRIDGLNLNIDYVDIKAPTIHIPADFVGPVASDILCEKLSRIEQVWVLDNEKACRIVIDEILRSFME
ncbi:hypothetical protein HDV01_006593 [Terramyces sp. JEL0728]|nr:hypothetical protein HDV01_006593 [Terramyces sp. JEL0728]